MIRKMRHADIPALMRLKLAAGWNQTAEDWRRLLRLEPQGCFVREVDGLIVGSTTVVRYATELAWLGMVLVLPAFRRQGIGRDLVHSALAWLDRSGTRACGLDATGMGRSLYEQLGFTRIESVERWERSTERNPGSAEGTAVPGRPLSPTLLRVDRESCGYDRSRLLLDFHADTTISSTITADGFVFARPGSTAWFVGPCVARDTKIAAAMLQATLEEQPRQRVFWDLLPANRPALKLATELGFRPVRRLERMMRHRGDSPAPCSHRGRIYATAGFELG